ncbi:MAG: polysaccharide biosynthesis tyrosine autokinase [Planctomycetota bacterium]
MTTLPSTVQERISLPARARVLPGEGGFGGGLTPGDVVSMLRRRMVLIVLLFILFSAMTVGGFLLWWFVFPGFRSECLIECISNIPETELTLDQQRLKEDEHERFVQTQALLLKSPNILSEALKVNAVRETDWYKSVTKRKLEHLLELTDDLSAAAVRGTNFLRVSIECRKTKDPAIIVNEVVRRWYDEVKKRSAEEFATDALEAAKKEESDAEREIASKRDRLKAIAARLPAGARENPGNNITAQNVRQYAEQVAQIELELSQLEQYRSIYSSPEGVAVTAEDRAIVEQDPQVAELSRMLFLLQQQRAADEKVYGAGHNVLKQLDAQIEAAEAKLAALRLERLNQRRADIREAANTAYDNSRHSLFVAQESLAKAEAELQDQDRLLFEYSDLDAQIQKDIEYQLQVSNYIKGLSRVKTQRTAIRVNVAQPAIDPLERSSPNLLLLPFGVVVALAMSLGIGLALELLDKSVRTSQDIVRHLDIAMLGAIPDTDDEEVAIKRVETAVRDAPRSMVAEAFRSIRTNLQFAAPADCQRTIIITSPGPEDGKTTVACNLAMVLAQGGRRVLLVDANLSRPALHKVFEGVKPHGLSNILVGDGALPGCVCKTNLPQLDLIGSGPIPPNPVDLLTGQYWRDFLRDAIAQYDQVLIDTPPVLLTSDAGVLATTVDGVILVVRANRNSRGVARRACNLLADVNAHLFGAVLNAARVTRGGYFRKQLRAYYEYQPEPGDGGKPLVHS